MAKFSYEAINESGATVTGVIDADTVESASTRLLARGFIPSKVTADKNGTASGEVKLSWTDRLTSVKPPDLILFTKQFRTLLKAGVPILTLLQVLENQTENPRLKKIATLMAQDIKEGSTLYDCFRKHPSVFSSLYCSMLRAGESSGAVPEILARLTYIIEHENKVKSDIKSALQYPMMVMISLGIAFFVLLTFVIPKFVTIFKGAGLQLPWPTLLCMGMYDFLNNYWYICLGGLVVFIVAAFNYVRTKQGRYVRDSVALRVPIIGPLFIKAAMSRFASIFAILQSSGVPVLESLKILSGTIGNTAIAHEFDKIREWVEEGRGIAAPLGKAKFFTPMVINMVAIGEESGNLDEMLREVSAHYDDEVAYAVGGLSQALGPILVVGLAGVVGFFAVAIFLPMWDLTQMATKGM